MRATRHLVTFGGWLIAGVLPFPLGPSDTPEEVVAFYGDGMHVSIGFVIATLGISLVTPLIAAISHLMNTGTPEARLLSLVQLVSGSVTAVMLLVPMLIMAVLLAMGLMVCYRAIKGGAARDGATDATPDEVGLAV